MIPIFEEETLEIPENVPLISLPEIVLLPGEHFPIHIFEDHFRAMIESALSSEKLVAITQVKPGWEKESKPDLKIYKIAGLGKIVMDERLSDGRFNLVILGYSRIKIEQIVLESLYRRAKVKILSDKFSQTSMTFLHSLGLEIIQEAKHLFNLINLDGTFDKTTIPSFEKLSLESLSLSRLCDFTAAIFCSPTEKQMILEETDVVARAEKLIFTLRFQIESFRSGFYNDLPRSW